MRAQLAHVHIPKCYGNSVRKVLEPHARVLTVNNVEDLVKVATHPPTIMRTDVLSGHFPFTPYLPRCFQFITFLRDPVERAWSQWRHLRNGQKSSQSKVKDEEMSFAQWLTTSDEGLRNWLWPTCFYLGQHACDTWPPTRKRVNAAKSVLAFDMLFVGFCDQWEQSIAALGETIGLDLDAGVRENVTPEDGFEMSDEERSLAVTVLQPEIELYEFAKQGRSM